MTQRFPESGDFRDAEELTRETEARLRGDKFGARYHHADNSVNKFVNWMASIGAILVSALMIWVASTTQETSKQVAILLDRPTPVSKAQYDQDRQEMLTKISSLQADVKDIQAKQSATINLQARP